MQVRCSVEGNANRRAYNGFAIGPLPVERDIGVTQHRARPTTTSHRYTIYSFIDLEADEIEYENGKPASMLNLKVDTFESLKCHLLGVVKAPVPFPRSNYLVVSASTFHELLRGASKQ